MTSNHHAPYDLGYTRTTMAGTTGSEVARWSESVITSYSIHYTKVYEFIYVFDEESSKFDDFKFLAQGTLYTDLVERGTATAQPIKSHQNVGGLPEDMKFELVEPLKALFKDEVRKVGEECGLPKEIVWRQPFPGPGLAIRVLGEVTEDKLKIVRDSDYILREEIANAGLDREIWQYFTALPNRITSYNVCYTKLLRDFIWLIHNWPPSINDNNYTQRRKMSSRKIMREIAVTICQITASPQKMHAFLSPQSNPSIIEVFPRNNFV